MEDLDQRMSFATAGFHATHWRESLATCIYSIFLVLVYRCQKDQSNKIERLHHMLTSDRKIPTSGGFLQPAQFDWIQATRKNLCQEQQSVGVMSQKSKKAIVKWQMTREM